MRGREKRKGAREKERGCRARWFWIGCSEATTRAPAPAPRRLLSLLPNPPPPPQSGIDVLRRSPRSGVVAHGTEVAAPAAARPSLSRSRAAHGGAGSGVGAKGRAGSGCGGSLVGRRPWMSSRPAAGTLSSPKEQWMQDRGLLLHSPRAAARRLAPSMEGCFLRVIPTPCILSSLCLCSLGTFFSELYKGVQGKGRMGLPMG